jgi:hypothetical protein
MVHPSGESPLTCVRTPSTWQLPASGPKISFPSFAELHRMPEISRFYGIVIRMFYNEHQPPHFHALYGE